MIYIKDKHEKNTLNSNSDLIYIIKSKKNDNSKFKIYLHYTKKEIQLI